MEDVILLFLSVFVISCAGVNNADDKDYTVLKSKNLSGNELLQAIINFEVEHSNHFESKVDLTDFYVLMRNYEKAYEYAVRAESVIQNAPKGDYGKKLVSILYGDRAKLELLLNNYDTALLYADKGIKAHKEHGEFIAYTKAQILAKQDKIAEALAILDSAYTVDSTKAVSDDLQLYMSLLVSENRFDDSRIILEKYFDTGHYFPGLGAIASQIYEKTGDFQKSILSTVIDFEYYSCFVDDITEKFLTNIEILEDKLKKDGSYAPLENVIAYLRSYFSNDVNVSIDIDFFVKDYIDSAKKIGSGKFTISDVDVLLKCEKNFSSFPSFYWRVYTAFLKIKPDIGQDAIPLLEKIITIGKNNLYVKKARFELGKLVGLDKNLADKILIPSEIVSLVYAYQSSANESELEPLFMLLDLPDNSYEQFALTYLKNVHSFLKLDRVIQKKSEQCSNRLKERLNYILN